MKKEYIPPTLEVFTYVVEKGFANSPNPDLLFDVSDSLENVEKGTTYTFYDDDEWF